jgi:2-aminoadipate transaminase
MLWIEDDPYGEIYFSDERGPDIHTLLPDKTIYLGSFSKIVSPGLRLGWACGPSAIIKKMTVAKQASDLHCNQLAQRIVYEFMCEHSLDDHLNGIRHFYKSQARTMEELIRQYFPKEVTFVSPMGGMFFWLVLPPNLSAQTLLHDAMAKSVIFVPGENFYIDRTKGANTLRLNFSNPSTDEMRKGLKILGEILSKMFLAK